MWLTRKIPSHVTECGQRPKRIKREARKGPWLGMESGVWRPKPEVEMDSGSHYTKLHLGCATKRSGGHKKVFPVVDHMYEGVLRRLDH